MKLPLINVTVGDPHYEAFQTRPFNMDVKFKAPEDPLVSVARVFKGAADIKKAFPDLGVSCSAASYLRHYAPNLAAGAIAAGMCDQVIFGRLAFANPNFANDIKSQGALTTAQACMACSKCSELIRAGVPTGCVLRDSEIYLPIYKELTTR
jgi:2,4-dienoyl-CoA reductase-like NADH-dependent reductase (Old Yellow Enzyme family)